jgi:hypothetical protein
LSKRLINKKNIKNTQIDTNIFQNSSIIKYISKTIMDNLINKKRV